MTKKKEKEIISSESLVQNKMTAINWFIELMLHNFFAVINLMNGELEI